MGTRRWRTPRTVGRGRLPERTQSRRDLVRRTNRLRGRHVRRDDVGSFISTRRKRGVCPPGARRLRRHPVRSGGRESVLEHFVGQAPDGDGPPLVAHTAVAVPFWNRVRRRRSGDDRGRWARSRRCGNRGSSCRLHYGGRARLCSDHRVDRTAVTGRHRRVGRPDDHHDHGRCCGPVDAGPAVCSCRGCSECDDDQHPKGDDDNT